jgi:hypothetical protein
MVSLLNNGFVNRAQRNTEPVSLVQIRYFASEAAVLPGLDPASRSSSDRTGTGSMIVMNETNLLSATTQ